MDRFALSAYDAEALSTDAVTAHLFEATVLLGADPKKVANWIQNDVSRLATDVGGEALQPAHLAELIRLVDDGVIGIAAARQVLPDVYRTGRSPRGLIDELGLAQVSDASALEAAARAVIDANPAAVADYKSGKVAAIFYIKGQLMKATGGKANQAVAEDLLRKLLA
jgi:aspartyl-tRNA(Asn)/glutamyl-tRNA(Gln) amidotransferase subunit B